MLHIAQVERETTEGIGREEAVQWYLEQREAELNTLEELETERALVRKVLSRLVKERNLILVDAEVDEEEQQQQSSSGENPTPTPRKVLMVHPRVDVDSLAV